MSIRFALVAAAVLAPVAAVAAPYHPEFMVPDSPERNALALMLWLLLIATGGAFTALAMGAVTSSRSATRRAAISVERARLRVRRRVI